MTLRPDFPLFPLAILKGVSEHADGTAYFGSTMAYGVHLDAARAYDYVKVEYVGAHAVTVVTAHGATEYLRLKLDKLPTKRFMRATAWNWHPVQDIMFPKAPRVPKKPMGKVLNIKPPIERQQKSELMARIKGAMVAQKLTKGYAYDIITDLLQSPTEVADSHDEEHNALLAGDLFRTLVLDEQWGVEGAREMWVWIIDLIGA